jgi:dTDP-4-amino-4,6-dideoxygalactose transaminase
MNVPFLDLKAQYRQIESEVIPAFREVCESCKFALGPFVESFEREFAQFCGAGHCVGVNSGTSALHLALRCLNVGPGDEVITVPMTFVATTWAISYVGARPVFVDIDPVSRTMDPRKLAAAITPRTRAIMPVHLYGQPADMDAILQIAAAHKLPVIEDAAQAHGAVYKSRPVGTAGCMSCFSFYPGKNLGAYGEGGALVTNEDGYAAMTRALRDHAQRQRYLHESVGYNYRMDNLQGAVLGIKLRRLKDWNAARRRHAQAYRQALADVPGITVPAELPGCAGVYHLFVIELDNRDAVAKQLTECGVSTGLHYPIPVHLQPAYADLGLAEGTFPVSERLARRCLSLPMFAELTDEQIQYVADCLKSAVAG